MDKRLLRSEDHRMIGGVCAGLAEYFNVDPTWIRLLAVLLIFAHGFGLVAYLVGWIVIPRKPLTVAPAPGSTPDALALAMAPVRKHSAAGGAALGVGAVLVLIGMIFLFDNLFWWFRWDYVWPLLFIGGGVLFIVHALRPSARTQHTEDAETTHAVEVPNGSR